MKILGIDVGGSGIKGAIARDTDQKVKMVEFRTGFNEDAQVDGIRLHHRITVRSGRSIDSELEAC